MTFVMRESDRTLSSSRKGGAAFLVICITGIIYLTLAPFPDWGVEKAQFFCFFCRDYSKKEVLANILLFVPMGVALRFHVKSVLTVLLIGSLLSLGIELLQFAVPGRTPTIQDVFLNTLGALIGGCITYSPLGRSLNRVLIKFRSIWDRCKRPPKALANRLLSAALLLLIAIFAATAWLFAPIFPSGRYLVVGEQLDIGATPLRIGASEERNEWFKGTIDEVRVYDRALTHDEVLGDMDKPVIAGESKFRRGLTVAYDFEKERGNRIADMSGLGNHGIRNGAARDVGKFGAGLSFDGHDDEVIIPYAPSLEFRNGFTLEAWIRPEGTQSAWPPVLQKDGYHYALYAGDESAAIALIPSGGGSFGGAHDGVYSPKAIPSGVWSHLAITYDGSVFQLYIDGRLVSSKVRWFQGHIEKMFVGDIQVRPGFVDREWAIRTLESGKTIRLCGSNGATTSGQGTLMRIQTEGALPVIALDVVGQDLVLRYLTVAQALGLFSPSLRFPNGLTRVGPGAPLEVELSGMASKRSLLVNNTTYDSRGLSLGMGWTVLVYSQALPHWLAQSLNVIWMALLTFLAGFWTTARLAFLLTSAIVITGILALPSLGEMASTPFSAWVGAAVGYASGIGTGWKVRRYAPSSF